MKNIFGIALVGLALAVAIIPQFTNCYSDGKVLTLQNGKTVPMKCHWTAEAEIAVAVPLLGVGAMMVASRKRESARNLSIMGIILGAVILALPIGLIGVCATPTMICHTVMNPSLLTLGSIVVVGSIGTLVIAQRSKDKEL